MGDRKHIGHYVALALGVAAWLTACGGRSHKATDGSVVRTIRNVEIKGNKKLSDKQIEAGLATREPKGYIDRKYYDLDSFDLERDRARIVAYYKRHGFFHARVKNVQVKNVGKSRADVVFEVFEGREGKVRQLIIDGAPGRAGVEEADLRRVSRLREGRRFNYEDFQDSKWRIRDHLIAAGYARARVTGIAEVDRRNFDVRIELEVDPGPRNVFGKTTVVGNKIVPTSSIEARLAWEEGEPFEPRKLAETRRRILSLGRFTTVRLEFEGPRERETADIKITVSEAPRNELRLGGGFGVDTANWLLRGRAGYKRHGVIDPLTTLSLDLRPAYAIVRGVTENNDGLVGEATVALTREDLWFPRLRGTASLSYTQQELEAYSSLGSRVRVALARGFLSERLRIGVAWRYHLLKLDVVQLLADDTATRDRLGASSPYSVGFFEQTIAYDGRDNPIDAKRGIYAEVRLEESGPYSASEFEFIKITPELRAYLPLGSPQLLFAARARLGRTISGSLPITQRYFAGGASSQRGFAQRQLSPIIGDPAADRVAIGGDSLFETNLETRWDFTRLAGEWLGLVLFLDGADATDQVPIDYGNLHWAAGFGLRYNTIVGPIRFDLGFRLNRREELEPRDEFAFHLSLGEAF